MPPSPHTLRVNSCHGGGAGGRSKQLVTLLPTDQISRSLSQYQSPQTEKRNRRSTNTNKHPPHQGWPGKSGGVNLTYHIFYEGACDIEQKKGEIRGSRRVYCLSIHRQSSTTPTKKRARGGEVQPKFPGHPHPQKDYRNIVPRQRTD